MSILPLTPFKIKKKTVEVSTVILSVWVAEIQQEPTDQVACSQTLYFLNRDRRDRIKTAENFAFHALSNSQKKREEKGKEKEKRLWTGYWLRCPCSERRLSLAIKLDNIFGGRGALIEMGGLFERSSLFNLEKSKVLVLHKELEYKVEKLKYKKLEVMQPRIENKSELPVGK